MPRYIDADELIKRIFPYDVVDKKCYTINAKMIYEEIRKAPTADVAPKSEAIKEYLAKVLAKKDTASHYAPGAEVVTVEVLEYYANTMTEGKNDG